MIQPTALLLVKKPQNHFYNCFLSDLHHCSKQKKNLTENSTSKKKKNWNKETKKKLTETRSITKANARTKIMVSLRYKILAIEDISFSLYKWRWRWLVFYDTAFVSKIDIYNVQRKTLKSIYNHIHANFSINALRKKNNANSFPTKKNMLIILV